MDISSLTTFWSGPRHGAGYCDGVDPAEIARHFLHRGVLVPGDNGALEITAGDRRVRALLRAADGGSDTLTL